jgi:repressor LexA
MDLTKKQKAVYDFLKDYRGEHGRPPSYVEIQRRFGLRSLNSVRKYLLQLDRKGFIRSPFNNQKRALEIVEKDAVGRSVAIPLLGAVAAGQPLDVSEVPDTIEVIETLVSRGEHFALRVRGDSMVGDGIFEGDLLIVLRREVADNGQTVVALVDGEATVKRFYKGQRWVELRPANPKYRSIYARPYKVRIQGVVVALVRNYLN